MNRLPKGLYPVMLTPFNDDYSIDIKALEELTEFYIKAGADGLFANCLSSEMFQLTSEERNLITKTVAKKVDGRVPVVATGTFGGGITKTSEFIKKIYNTGVEAVVINTNQLNDRNDPEEYFKKQLEKILNATDNIPLGLYECPMPYKRLVSPSLMNWLGSTNRFLYHKDTSCNIDQIKEKIDAIKDSPLGLFNANTPTGILSMKEGAMGLSPVAANYYPELFAYLLKNYSKPDNNYEKVESLVTLLDSIADGKHYPLLAKITLGKRGLKIKPITRTPVPALDQQDVIILEKLLTRIKKETESIGLEFQNASK